MRLSLEQVIEIFFKEEKRTVRLENGMILFREGDPNERLYYVKEGQLSFAQKNEANDHTDYLLIRSGDFTGIQSFLNPGTNALTTTVADEPTTLVYATEEDLAGHPDYDLSDVLIPIFGYAMESRQQSIFQLMAQEGRERLDVEGKKRMELLGQFSGGVAHELNNAIAVVEQGSRWLPVYVEEMVKKSDPLLHKVFLGGLNQKRLSSKELRERAREIVKTHDLEMNLARKCAHARLDDKIIEDLYQKEKEEGLQEAYETFEIGSVLHNMAIASEQAASVVDSMRNLGASNDGKGREVSLDETIQRSLTILRNITKGVRVHYKSPPKSIEIMGNKGEFVQVWTNLIRNGCDAIRSEKNPDPQIEVELKMTEKGALVSINDNGPGIPEYAHAKIFQPNYTTKKSGLKFGLGIGLSIVKSIVESYDGRISVRNGGSLGGALFETLIPLVGE